MGATWAGDTIYYSFEGGGVHSVPSGGGVAAEVVTPAAAHEADRLPHVLPGGKAILYTVVDDPTDRLDIVGRTLPGGTPKILVHDAADARYLEVGNTGYLLYMKAGALMGARFDADRLELTSQPITLIDGVTQAVAMPNSALEVKVGQFSVSANGTLAYVRGGINLPVQDPIEWATRDGAMAPAGVPLGQYFGARVSPDGRRVALASVRSGSRKSDIQLYDVDRPFLRRLTTEGNNYFPVWLDNQTILFARDTGQGRYIAELNVDSNAAPTPFGSADYHDKALAASVSGGALAILIGNDIFSLRLDDRDAEPTPVVRSTALILGPTLSPDGRRVAYASLETGQPEVYVVSFPSGVGKVRVSPQGGHSPAWSRDGRELYYLRSVSDKNDRLEFLAVPVGASFGDAHVLFTAPTISTFPLRSYDTAPNGRFLLVQQPQAPEPPATQIELVFNWTTELEKRVGAPSR